MVVMLLNFSQMDSEEEEEHQMALNIPEEVVIEILSWLPAISLLRFRCVCKIWFHLLTTDSRFINLHLNHSTGFRNHNMLARRMGKIDFYLSQEFTSCHKALELDIPFKQGNNCYFVYGICNGMICLADREQKEVYLWNPVKDYVSIPCLPAHTRAKKNTSFGFGFVPGSNEYKLVRIAWEAIYEQSDYASHVTVFTLRVDSSWRSLDLPVPYHMDLTKFHASLVNGALHWFVRGATPSKVILSFDLKNEVFIEIPPPRGVSIPNQFHVAVGELGGSFCMFCSHLKEDVQIWVMREYGVAESWEKQFDIRLPDPVICGSFVNLEPLCVTNNREVLLRMGTLKLVLYKENTDSIMDLPPFEFGFSRVYNYVGSLVSPKVICGVEQISERQNLDVALEKLDVDDTSKSCSPQL